MTDLVLNSVRKSFGEVDVLHGIDLDVADGEFVVFVGPSGCGKSTLLRLICGLDEITGGDLAIDGEIVNDVPPSKRGIAMVFQTYALYPHMSVAENMGYSLRLAKFPKGEIGERVARAARTLQIEKLLDRKPRELSGGQRQRVAIGRAIVRDPKIFLFDEPLSNLDAALRVEMRLEIARLKERLGTTMIYVTHDQTEAMTLADRIVVLNAGRVEQVGTPLELYRTPANRFVASFIGAPKMNFLSCTVEAADTGVVADLGGGLGVHLPEAEVEPGHYELGIRPEDVEIARADAATGDAQVNLIEHLGSDTFAYLILKDRESGERDPAIARLPGDSSVRAKDHVAITLDPEACQLFDEEGNVAWRSARRYAEDDSEGAAA